MDNNFMDLNSMNLKNHLKTEQSIACLLEQGVSISPRHLEVCSELSYVFPNVRNKLILYTITLQKYILNKNTDKNMGPLGFVMSLLSDELTFGSYTSDGFFVDICNYFMAMELFPFDIKIHSYEQEVDKVMELLFSHGSKLAPREFRNYDDDNPLNVDIQGLLSDYIVLTFTVSSDHIDLYLDKYFYDEEKRNELIFFIEELYTYISPEKVSTGTTLIRRNDSTSHNKYSLQLAVTESPEPDSAPFTLGDYYEGLEAFGVFNTFLLENI